MENDLLKLEKENTKLKEQNRKLKRDIYIYIIISAIMLLIMIYDHLIT